MTQAKKHHSDDDHPADWLLWLAGRMVLDSTTEIALSAVQGVQKWSQLETEVRTGLEAELADPAGQLLPAIADAIFQLRPLLLPLVAQFRLSRLTAAQAATLRTAAAEVTVPWKTLEGLNLSMARLLEFMVNMVVNMQMR
jgi:hypothetical protein